MEIKFIKGNKVALGAFRKTVRKLILFLIIVLT